MSIRSRHDILEERLNLLQQRCCCNKPVFRIDFNAFPEEGVVDTLYVDESNGAIYIWDGAAYITANLQPIHTNATRAVAYTGTELPVTAGVVIGDTVSVQFNNGIISDYTWNGTVWTLNFTSKSVVSKIYKALLSQAGVSAPTATILENTLGTISYSYEEPGTYVITSAGLFTAKTAIFFGNIKQDGPTPNSIISGYKIDNSNYLIFTTDSRVGGSYNLTYDGVLLNTLLTIEVYP